VDGTLASFLPPPVLHELQQGIADAHASGWAVHRILQWQTGERTRDYQASFIPVERIGEERELTLVVLSDLTELQQVQRRHMDLLRRLVLTLVSAVDRHDPYSANHAQRMTRVADALARELGFTDQERSALDLAASLANIGKVMIPVEVLTKTTPLTADEQALLHKHVEYGLELLRGLEFEGPVTDMIAQKQERPDGRGYPRGIAGERITLGGQVLAVANAFVALTSARAYRPGLTTRLALDELMRGAGSQFDRRVIAALFHVAENRRDWSAS
jgi:HD-GYP domain-containing protein (c-di-GMP phosphodiesterase class II)